MPIVLSLCPLFYMKLFMVINKTLNLVTIMQDYIYSNCYHYDHYGYCYVLQQRMTQYYLLNRMMTSQMLIMYLLMMYVQHHHRYVMLLQLLCHYNLLNKVNSFYNNSVDWSNGQTQMEYPPKSIRLQGGKQPKLQSQYDRYQTNVYGLFFGTLSTSKLERV